MFLLLTSYIIIRRFCFRHWMNGKFSKETLVLIHSNTGDLAITWWSEVNVKWRYFKVKHLSKKIDVSTSSWRCEHWKPTKFSKSKKRESFVSYRFSVHAGFSQKLRLVESQRCDQGWSLVFLRQHFIIKNIANYLNSAARTLNSKW